MTNTKEIRAEVEEGVYREFKAVCARRGRTVKEVLGFLMEQEVLQEVKAREDSARALLEKIPWKKPDPSKPQGGTL